MTTALRIASLLSFLVFSASPTTADMPQSSGLLEFGPDNVLFVADSFDASVSAYSLPAYGSQPQQDVAFNLLDLDPLVSNALGSQGRLNYGDLAVHPVTQRVA